MVEGMGVAGDIAYQTYAFIGGLMFSTIGIIILIIAFLLFLRIFGGANKSPRVAIRTASKDIFGRTKSIYKSNNPLKRGWF